MGQAERPVARQRKTRSPSISDMRGKHARDAYMSHRTVGVSAARALGGHGTTDLRPIMGVKRGLILLEIAPHCCTLG